MSATTPKTAIAVTHWKAGTNLLLRVMQDAGLHCVGAGTGIEPGAGSRPESVKVFDALLETAKLPAGTCMFLHQLPLDEIPLPVARHYVADPARPKLVYNYRDPRAVLVSAVNYLRRTPPPDHHAPYLFLAPILARFPSTTAALSAAVDLLGDSIAREYRASLWLRHHPDACVVRYEDLVGAAGGGDDGAQLDCVTRLLAHVGSERDPREVARSAFDRGSRTFFRGQRDAWKADYEPGDLRRFMARHGDLVAAFGYDVDA